MAGLAGPAAGDHGHHAARPARGRAGPPRGQQHPGRHQGAVPRGDARAPAASCTPASAARGRARRRSRSRPRRPFGSFPTRSSARPSRRRPACGAASRPRPRRCGRRRTDGTLLADAGLERREAGRWCSAACRSRPSPRGPARRPTCTTPMSSGGNTGHWITRSRRCRIALAYAVKANANLAVLRILRDLGAGADIVSGGELARALAAGFPPDRIVFSGVGKSDEELRGRGGRRHRAHPPRVGRGAGRARRDRGRRGAPHPGRDPGQSRRHRRHPPVHRHRPGRHQVRRAVRPGGAARARGAAGTRTSSSTPSRCISEASC